MCYPVKVRVRTRFRESTLVTLQSGLEGTWFSSSYWFQPELVYKCSLDKQGCRKYSPTCQMGVNILTDELKIATTSLSGNLYLTTSLLGNLYLTTSLSGNLYFCH